MLDSMDAIRSVDKKDMIGSLERMPKQLLEGLTLGRKTGVRRFAPESIFVGGMGGSAIGGDLLCEWLSSSSDIPCSVIRSYAVPSHLSKDSLVIIASYSGNTEETLAMFEVAQKKQARVVAIASGGELARLSRANDVPFVKLPGGMMPRASLGYMLGALIGIVERVGAASADRQLEETSRVLKSVVASCGPSKPTVDNLAKRLAHELHGFVPIVVGYGLSRPVAKRWANQFNENSKSMAFSSEIPELNHNEIIGWMKDRLSKGFAAILLDNEQKNRALAKRVEATKDMLARVAPVYRVKSMGTSPLAQMMSLSLVGDFVSVYLGVLREEDPSSNEPIDELKAVLSKK